MKGTDLRIGNLIYDFGDGEGQVLAIDKDGYVLTTANDVPQPAETFTGIPLTEDWLIKFGFEKIKSDYEEAETYNFSFELLYFNMANQSTKINGRSCLSYVPEYVHQLQNLVFVLIGTELTIKP